MAITYNYSQVEYISDGSTKKAIVNVTLDSSYSTGGYEIDPTKIAFSRVLSVDADGAPDGYNVYYSKATGNLVVYSPQQVLNNETITIVNDASAATYDSVYVAVNRQTSETFLTWNKDIFETAAGVGSTSYFTDPSIAETIIMAPTNAGFFQYQVIHDASASTNGTQVYFRVTEPLSNTGILVSNNANSASALWNLANVSATDDDIVIFYDANAGGSNFDVPLYFDEDGSLGARMLVNSPTASNVYIRTNGGKWIPLVYDNSASTTGVAVYFDDNAANEDERMLFVSPTTTNGLDLGQSTVGLEFASQLSVYQLLYDPTSGVDDGDRLIYNNLFFTADSLVRWGDRFLKITQNAAVAGTTGIPVYIQNFDLGIPFNEKLRADFSGAGNEDKTISFSTSSVPFVEINPPQAEVPAGTDLSSVTFDLVVIGY